MYYQGAFTGNFFSGISLVQVTVFFAENEDIFMRYYDCNRKS